MKLSSGLGQFVVLATIAAVAVWLLLGRSDAHLEKYKAEITVLELKNEDLLSKIQARDGQISALNDQIREILYTGAESLNEKDLALADKEAELARLEAEQADLTGYRAKYEKQIEITEGWIEKYNLVLEQYREVGRPTKTIGADGAVKYVWPEGSIVFDLIRGYELKIAALEGNVGDYKQLWEGELAARRAAETLMVEYKRKAAASVLRFKATAGGAVILAVILGVAAIG